MYGPHFPLHSDKYLRVRLIPKLLDDDNEMFRYYSCKFKNEKLKMRTARIVLHKEFNITNCFTLEASMFGYIKQQDKAIRSDRTTEELTTELLKDQGQGLASCFTDYFSLLDEDLERQKQILRDSKKRKALKTKNLTSKDEVMSPNFKESEAKSTSKRKVLSSGQKFHSALVQKS